MWQSEELPMKEGQGQNTVTWIWSEYEHYEMVPMKENVFLNGWVHAGGALFGSCVDFWKHALVG